MKNDIKYKDIQGDPGKSFLFATPSSSESINRIKNPQMDQIHAEILVAVEEEDIVDVEIKVVDTDRTLNLSGIHHIHDEK